MKIETMLHALVDAHGRYRGVYQRRQRQYVYFRAAIARRYNALQAENARLRDEVAFWKAEALGKGGEK